MADSLVYLSLIIGGVLLLLLISFECKKRREGKSKPPTVTCNAASYRQVVDRAVQSNRIDDANRAEERIRREESDRSTNSNHHIINMSGQSEQTQQDEILEPPPPYFRDGDLPRYARNV